MKTLLCLLVILLGLSLPEVYANVIQTRQPTPEYELLYGHNPPRINPDYCIGFRITYPTYPGQAYEVGSIQEIRWEVDKGIPHQPDSIYRIRILNSTNNNEYIIGENLKIYTDDYKGRVFFPLDVNDITGLYHYRVMVNYPGTTIRCIFESVPFMIIQDPSKNHTAPGPRGLLPQPPVDPKASIQPGRQEFPKSQLY